MTEPKVTRRKIDELTPDFRNANRGTERGHRALDDSVNEVGLGRSVLVDKNGTLIAGNKTHQAAVDNGFEDVIEVETDGNTLVVVKRTDLDLNDPSPDNKARRAAYYDNRVGQLNLDFDPAILLSDLNAGVKLDNLFSEDELAELLAGMAQDEPADDPGAQVDRADELQQKWQVQRGQVWHIGKHRLMCGDSTSAEDIARLMDGAKFGMVFTDPPYGIDYDHASTGRAAPKFDKIENDDLKGADFQAFNVAWLSAVMAFACDDASYYVCGANRTAHLLIMAAEQLKLHYAVPLVWVKQHFSLSWDRYHPQHEYIFYGGEGSKPTGGKSRWFGAKNETTVWQIDRDHSGDYEHPTQKPVELPARAIRNSSARDEIVADFFTGSGTTLVACEQTGRQGRGMELAEKYVSVCLQRLSDMGLTPELAR